MKGKRITISELSTLFSNVLFDVGDVIWMIKIYDPSLRLRYSDDAFAATATIFFDAMLSKMWELQEKDDASLSKRCLAAEACGNELHDLVKKFTGISMREIYKTE